jgi:hypothetical protein
MSEKIKNKTTRKERKKARNAFALFLKRLRKMCEIIDKVNDWQTVVAEAENLLHIYQDAIPAEKRRRIREALELPEATLQGVNQACQLLKFEVEGLIKYLKPAPALATLLTASVIVVVAAVFVAAVVSNIVAVDITIRNQGCEDLYVADALGDNVGIVLANNLLLSPFGIELPEVIAMDSVEQMTMPPLAIHVDNETNPNALSIDIYGVMIPFTVGQASEILFDGDSILGVQKDIDLGQGETHELTIICGG